MSKFHKNKEYFENADWTVDKVKGEINSGLELLNEIDQPIITFFGSARVKPESENYRHAKELAYNLGKNGYAILSGGGPGIMHAACSGATESGCPSIGFGAELLATEKVTDKIFTHNQSFHFLFARRFLMAIKSEALIFYPGGYGTLNELFEYAVLMQTGIVDKVPLICMKKDYWQGLFDWLDENVLKENLLINGENDIKLLNFAENYEDVIELLKCQK